MLTTTIVAKLTHQDTPDFILHLSFSDLAIIVNSMEKTTSDSPVFKEFAENLRELLQQKTIFKPG